MFCPNCGVEYRPGFTHCNDCDVDLVEQLPAEGTAVEREEEGSETSLELLWRGTSGGTFNAIAAALDDAGIPYNREELDPRLTFGSGYAPLEIWVPAEQIDAAHRVREETLALLAQPIAMAETPDTTYTGDDEAETPGFVKDPHPEDAIAEVWSGDSADMAEFLKSCLAANGIGCCVNAGNPKAVSVCVLPEDESRAKEIVRQVVEGNAPA